MYKINKGDKFECTEHYFMKNKDLAFKKGVTYTSLEDGTLNSLVDVVHKMESELDFDDYFKKVKSTEQQEYEKQSFVFDQVTIKTDKPKHYSKGIDTFERMEKNCDYNQRLGFVRGSIDAYLWREKGEDRSDFEKIINYCNWAIKQIDNEKS